MAHQERCGTCDNCKILAINKKAMISELADRSMRRIMGYQIGPSENVWLAWNRTLAEYPCCKWTKS